MRNSFGLGMGLGRVVEETWESRILRRTVWLGEIGSSGVERAAKSEECNRSSMSELMILHLWQCQ